MERVSSAGGRLRRDYRMSGFLRLLLATAMAVLGWLASPATAVSLSTSLRDATYVFDAPVYNAPGSDAASGRGPPTDICEYTTYDAFDHESHGSSARTGARNAPTIYDYDDTARFVRSEGSSHGVTGLNAGSEAGLVVVQRSQVAAKTAPEIKAGAQGGPTAGKPFSQKTRQDVLDENPSTCVYCRMETDRPQVGHAIPRSRGGNATFENGQTTCGWGNASKGARDYPVNPPPGFEGMWPPLWWGLP